MDHFVNEVTANCTVEISVAHIQYIGSINYMDFSKTIALTGPEKEVSG